MECTDDSDDNVNKYFDDNFFEQPKISANP
jgi:hypothetical protein